MRLHGDREPHDRPPMSDHGGGMCVSGADNEVWSYGEEAYAICRKYLSLRERLRPYIRGLMQRTHETADAVRLSGGRDLLEPGDAVHVRPGLPRRASAGGGRAGPAHVPARGPAGKTSTPARNMRAACGSTHPLRWT